MGQIEDLVERFISQDTIFFKDFDIENIENLLKKHIENCEELGTQDKIKAYSFLYDKCDYIIKNIELSMNYVLWYEPTDDDIWSFVEQEKKRIDPKSDDLSQYENFIITDCCYFDESTLYDYVIDKMRDNNNDKNKDAFEWCEKIQDIKFIVYRKISKEKEKSSFFDEALNAETEIVKTSMDEYTHCPDKGKLNAKLVQLLRGEGGTSTAKTMIALDKLGYIDLEGITKSEIFPILQAEFAVKGKVGAFVDAFVRIGDGEEIKTKTSIENKMDILKQE